MSAHLTISRVHICIRPGTGDARRATTPYLVHQAVADLFGDRPERGYLFRVMREAPGEVVTLVLSTDPPSPVSELQSPPHRRATAIESQPYAPVLATGQPLDFELRVNAVKQHVSGPKGSRKTSRQDVWEAVWQKDKHTPLTPAEVYREWLSGKLAGGATVHSVHVTERGEQQARRPAGGEAARFVVANLIGALVVDDPSTLLAAIAAGLGRSRAFGCGLLCLSRPGTVLPRRYPSLAAALR